MPPELHQDNGREVDQVTPSKHDETKSSHRNLWLLPLTKPLWHRIAIRPIIPQPHLNVH